MKSLRIFDDLESDVRSYCRSFPTVFTWSSGYKMRDNKNREYIDFFAGAGGLNYGHNPASMKEKLIEYLAADGIVHGLDMATQAKREFLKKFNEIILEPRKMNHKMMFPGPTGTNAVESALKLARKVTGRTSIMCFTNAFHGMTSGSLAVTGNAKKRRGAGVPLGDAVFMPYDCFLGENVDTIDYIHRYLNDTSSGVELPAAIILETVQGEGGLNVAKTDWLRRIEALCREKEILLIVDDIQAGCGRTGTFFSFEPSGISPDIICLSKSISGYGIPMAITLIKPEYDIWSPGEHNGTFRGHNLAFVTATEALNYWKDDRLAQNVRALEKVIRDYLLKLVKEHPEIKGKVRGRGFMQGISCGVDGLAEKICFTAFEKGLIMETAGSKNEVAKVMPALTIDEAGLLAGLQILEDSIKDKKVQSFININENTPKSEKMQALG